jgi:acyl carrier protein
MAMPRAITTQHPTRAGLGSEQLRQLIAQHFGVALERVTDEAHFADDLGADWLDRIELMIVIEDQFAGVEITDDDADQINVVGDLIRHVESLASEQARRNRSVAKSWLQ